MAVIFEIKFAVGGLNETKSKLKHSKSNNVAANFVFFWAHSFSNNKTKTKYLNNAECPWSANTWKSGSQHLAIWKEAARKEERAIFFNVVNVCGHVVECCSECLLQLARHFNSLWIQPEFSVHNAHTNSKPIVEDLKLKNAFLNGDEARISHHKFKRKKLM